MKYLLTAVVICCISCVKEKSCENCKVKSDYTDATVVFEGPLETDGCGWLIKTDSLHTYHPDTLNASFLQNNLAVKIKYQLTTDVFHCGIANSLIPVIQLIDITR
jgi:hypothetical protein